MGHYIQAIIAPQEVIDKEVPTIEGARKALLSHGLAAIPITSEVWDEIQERPGVVCDVIPEGRLLRGSPVLYELLSEVSQSGPAIYVETEYFGGVGEQFAIIAENGDIVSFWEGDHPINEALRKLGIEAEEGLDEFDTVGLGLTRSNEAMLERTLD